MDGDLCNCTDRPALGLRCLGKRRSLRDFRSRLALFVASAVGLLLLRLLLLGRRAGSRRWRLALNLWLRLEILGLDVWSLHLRRWRCRAGLFERALLRHWLRGGRDRLLLLLEWTLLQRWLCGRRDLLLLEGSLARDLLRGLLLGRELWAAGILRLLRAARLLDLLERTRLEGRAGGGLALRCAGGAGGQVHLAGCEGADAGGGLGGLERGAEGGGAAAGEAIGVEGLG